MEHRGLTLICIGLAGTWCSQRTTNNAINATGAWTCGGHEYSLTHEGRQVAQAVVEKYGDVEADQNAIPPAVRLQPPPVAMEDDGDEEVHRDRARGRWRAEGRPREQTVRVEVAT